MSKYQKIVRYAYDLPWCVPPWGWSEFVILAACILNRQLVEGPDPIRFATAVKAYLGVAFAVPLNCGRAAIELALKAMDLRDTDEVVLPSYLCRSVLDAVQAVGCRPVFADVGPDLHLTPETVEAVITPRTKCVIVPHLFGNSAPIDAIEQKLSETEIIIIDDAAQSFGARRSGRLVGTFGRCGIISCGPGKPLVGAAGGVLVTDDPELYQRVMAMSFGRESAPFVLFRMLSFWVWRRFRRYTLTFRMLLGKILNGEEQNSYQVCTMSNLDAGVALQQLHHLRVNVSRRRENSNLMFHLLGKVGNYSISDLSEDGMLVKLVLASPSTGSAADSLISAFGDVGIECQKGYIPLHYKKEEKHTSLRFTEQIFDRVVCIPLEGRIAGCKDSLRKTFEPCING